MGECKYDEYPVVDFIPILTIVCEVDWAAVKRDIWQAKADALGDACCRELERLKEKR